MAATAVGKFQAVEPGKLVIGTQCLFDVTHLQFDGGDSGFAQAPGALSAPLVETQQEQASEHDVAGIDAHVAIKVEAHGIAQAACAGICRHFERDGCARGGAGGCLGGRLPVLGPEGALQDLVVEGARWLPVRWWLVERASNMGGLIAVEGGRLWQNGVLPGYRCVPWQLSVF